MFISYGMNFFFAQNFAARALERKKTLIFLAAVLVIFTILGLCFVSSPAVYEYHLSVCDSFVLDVCFSDTNVFFIFLSRLGGCALLIALVLVGSLHPVAIILPVAVLVYRAFTFGGSLYVFFDFYGLSGAMIVLILYFPIHLLTDALLLLATSVSIGNAFRFCFTRADVFGLFKDFLTALLCAVFIYLAEMILLLALFHPIGKIL